MATLLEWEEEIKKLPQAQRGRIINALRELEAWERFKNEYAWTEMFTLRTMLEAIQKAEV